jgi:hypothetical protein
MGSADQQVIEGVGGVHGPIIAAPPHAVLWPGFQAGKSPDVAVRLAVVETYV